MRDEKRRRSEQLIRSLEGWGRSEFALFRTVATIAVPIAAAFYSWLLALVVAIPCALILYWRFSRRIR